MVSQVASGAGRLSKPLVCMQPSDNFGGDFNGRSFVSFDWLAKIRITKNLDTLEVPPCNPVRGLSGECDAARDQPLL